MRSSSFAKSARSGRLILRAVGAEDPRELPRRTTDVLVVGGGVAGLSAAITASETRDTLALLKTVASRVPALTEAIVSLHPYDVPEVLALPAVGGSAAYLAWVGSAAS